MHRRTIEIKERITDIKNIKLVFKRYKINLLIQINFSEQKRVLFNEVRQIAKIVNTWHIQMHTFCNHFVLNQILDS